jgi:cyclic beta-1,2-glucan synthetase
VKGASFRLEAGETDVVVTLPANSAGGRASPARKR